MSSKVHKTKEMREFEPLLKRNGFRYSRCRGSHFIYIRRSDGRHITINKDLTTLTKARLIKENDLR